VKCVISQPVVLESGSKQDMTYSTHGELAKALFASEQMVDELAIKMGIDPLELRYNNALREGEVDLATGKTHVDKLTITHKYVTKNITVVSQTKLYR